METPPKNTHLIKEQIETKIRKALFYRPKALTNTFIYHHFVSFQKLQVAQGYKPSDYLFIFPQEALQGQKLWCTKYEPVLMNRNKL